MCSAAGAAGFFDYVATAEAWCTLLTKYLEVVGEISSVTTSIDEVLKGGTTDFD